MTRIPEGVDLDQLTVAARRVLLDGLVALEPHLSAITVIGAQAVYLRSADATLATASYTSDGDLGIDPQLLRSEPHLDVALRDAGDVLRLMMVTRPADVAATLRLLCENPRVGAVAVDGLRLLRDLFGGRRARGVDMAVEALRGDVPEARVRAGAGFRRGPGLTAGQSSRITVTSAPSGSSLASSGMTIRQLAAASEASRWEPGPPTTSTRPVVGS
jgi:hypothetical protein